MPAQDTLPEGTDTIIEGAGASAEEADMPEADETFEEDDEAEDPAPPAEAAQSAAAGEDADVSLKSRLEGFSGKAGDAARDFVQAGKDRVTASIDEVVRMIEDAAQEVDAKIGTNYGDYARRAAGSIDGIAQTIKDKDVDTLFADARALIARSPGAAIGIAAALGFVIARIARAGLPGEPTAAAAPSTAA